MEKKRYVTVQELLTAAIEKAKKEDSYKDVEVITDYMSRIDNQTELRFCAFHVFAETTFGNCEGIYTDIVLRGYLTQKEKKEEIRPGCIKTLRTDREAMEAMAKFGATICYYAMKYIDDNIGRFD